MDFGIVHAKIDEIGYITHAENLGYTHCWVTDSQMIRSNVFAVLALAAQATRTMKIGSGVCIPGLRLAPVAANGIATINRIAPGRVFCGLGTGHTAMRTIGQRPAKLKDFAEYVRVVRALLNGEVVDYELNGKTTPITFQMRELRFIDVDTPIPVYIAAFGPKAQALAGELGDGMITGFPRGGTIGEAMANVRKGAERAGRSMDGFYTTAMTTLVLLEPGEDVMSERVLSMCGASVISQLHYYVSLNEETGAEPPAYLHGMWKPYMDWLNARPPKERHRLLHETHYSKLDPEEARFLTPEVMRSMCVIGEPEELVEQLQELERQGLNQAIVYPPVNRLYRTIEDMAEKVMSRM